MLERKKTTERLLLDEIPMQDERGVFLSSVVQKLKLGLEKCGNARLELDITNDWDGTPDEVELFAVFERDETDLEWRNRLASERRARATQAAFSESKKAREILKLKADAKRLGFVIATPAPE